MFPTHRHLSFLRPVSTGCMALPCCALPLQVFVAFSFRSDDLYNFNHVEGVEL